MIPTNIICYIPSHGDTIGRNSLSSASIFIYDGDCRPLNTIPKSMDEIAEIRVHFLQQHLIEVEMKILVLDYTMLSLWMGLIRSEKDRLLTLTVQVTETCYIKVIFSATTRGATGASTHGYVCKYTARKLFTNISIQ